MPWIRAGVAAMLMGLFLASCAPKTPPPVAPGAPAFPDFVFPSVPPRLGDQALATRHSRAWQRLQAGDTRGAEQEYATMLRRSPGFFPAETAFAYVRVAEQQYREAVARFDRVLAAVPSYAPALAGKGEAQLAAGDRDLALASFEAALKADPTLADLSRRIDVLRFDHVRTLVAEGKRAADAGRLPEARRAYSAALAASPESAFLHRDLGLVELRLGALAEAADHLRTAIALDATDARALVGLAEVLDRSGDLTGAVDALDRAVALDPSEANREALARARERAETSALPADYRGIRTLPQVTRGDLAALVGVRLQPLVARARQRSGIVATDVRGHWAATWIMSVTRAGLMDVFANHTFQPRASVRRADLADVVSRVLAAAGLLPAAGRARVPMADMGPDHLGYTAAAATVSSGVMSLNEKRQFRPSAFVSGAEAVDAVGRLEALVLKRRVE